jgi:hypothetical protein
MYDGNESLIDRKAHSKGDNGFPAFVLFNRIMLWFLTLRKVQSFYIS